MLTRLAVTLALSAFLPSAALASGLDDVDYQGAHADWTPGTTLASPASARDQDDAARPALVVRLGGARPAMADLGESIGQPEVWAAGQVPETAAAAVAAPAAATPGQAAGAAACGCAMASHLATHG